MRCDARLQSNFRVFDLDTCIRITPVQWADDETGEYCVFVVKGGVWQTDPITGRILTEVRKGRIKVVPDWMPTVEMGSLPTMTDLSLVVPGDTPAIVEL